MSRGPAEPDDQGVGRVLATCRIKPGELRRIRALVDEVAQDRVGPERAPDWVIAVNEVVTNVIAHGGGYGTLTLWEDEQYVSCEVVDNGPGLDDVNPGCVPPDMLGGEHCGMWLARALSTAIEVESAPGAGTRVRLLFDRA